jgi:hypothetical protein
MWKSMAATGRVTVERWTRRKIRVVGVDDARMKKKKRTPLLFRVD